MLRIREAVPAPLRHGRQQHALFMKFGKSLQPSDVSRKGELAVTYRQRRERVGISQDDHMPSHQRLTVDGPSYGRRRQAEAQSGGPKPTIEEKALEHHSTCFLRQILQRT